MPDKEDKQGLHAPSPISQAPPGQDYSGAKASTGPTEVGRLHKTIEAVLQSIRRQQQALQQVRDTGHNPEIVQQRIERVVTLHSQVQDSLQTAARLDEALVSPALEKNARIQTQLAELTTLWQQHNEQTPTGRVLKKRLHEILFHLQDILSDVNATLNDVSTVEQANTAARDQVRDLEKSLAQENQLLTVCDLGQSQKAAILMQLHQMTLLIYRLRHLSSESRLSQRMPQLEGIALQAKDTIDTLDMEASNVLEVVDSSLGVLDRQLCKLEYSRRFTPGIGWCVNRYRDVKRLKSLPARVLSGLGFSLALSGLMFITAATILSGISTYASYSQIGLRKSLEEKQTELVDKVSIRQEQAQKQVVLTIQIQEIDNRIVQEEQKQLAEQEESAQLAAQLIEDEEPQPVNSGEESAPSLNTNSNSVPARSQAENRADASPSRPDSQEAPEQTTQRDRLVIERENLQEEKTEIEGDLQETNDAISQFLKEIEDLQVEADTDGAQLSNNREISRGVWVLWANFLNSQGLLDHTMRVILAAFSGLVGSMMSILIRLDQMEKESINNPFLLGALKPLIGAIFGIAGFAILSTGVIDILPASFQLRESPRVSAAREPVTTQATTKRDPLGDLDSQEVYKIFLVAFIAGFSERLANDTLRSVSSTRSGE